MKSLREYLDQLDEISRRDFLKTAGAAVTGAALSRLSPAQAESAGAVARYAADLAVKTVLGRLRQQSGYDLRNYISENIYNFVSTACVMGRCPDKNLINRVNQLAADESGISKMTFASGFLSNMKNETKDFVLAYRNHLIDELDRSPSQKTPDSATSDERQQRASTTTASLNLSDFESRLLDNGLVLYVYASRQNHESQSAIKAALNRLAQRTGAAERINQRLREISADPGRYGASTRPDQYFQQVNQIIRNIDELGAR